MRVLIIIVLLLVGLVPCYSQKNKKGSLIKSKQLFEKLLSTEFSKIMTGNSFSNFGSYASVSTKDETLTISGIILDSLNTNKVWTYNVSGGVSDGITSAFDNFKLNSNIGASISFNYIINPFKTNRVSIDEASERKINENLEKLRIHFVSDSIDIIAKKELIELKYQKLKLLKKEKSLDSLYRVYKPKKSSLRKDSINFAFQKLKHNKSILLNKEKKLTDEEFSNKLFELYQKYDKDLAELEKKKEEIKVEDLDITWFSFGYGIRKDKFNLFDSSLTFDKQINDSTTVSHKINLGVSRYRWGNVSKRDIFWAFSTEFQYGSNLSDLTGIEIVDTTPISTTPQREQVKKTNAFVDEFKSGVKRIAFKFDYYSFFGKKNEFALHLNPKIEVADFVKPTTSFLTGILIPFKDKEKQTSIVNLEVFYQLNDVFNVNNAEIIIFGRNSIGIKASFPITFY